MRIEAKGLSYTYPDGTAALRGIDLQVQSGETVLILGHNGAGKSTFVKHLNGILKPTGGDVFVGEVNTKQHEVSELVHSVALSFQNPDDQIFSNTVFEEVEFGPRNLGKTNFTALAKDALRLLHLDDDAPAHPYDLHASRRKMLTIASAVAMDTPIVVFDEPTVGFDVRQKKIFASLVETLKERKKTILIISHDVDYFFQMCESIVVIHSGIIEFSGNKSALAKRKDHRALLRRSGLPTPTLWRMSRAFGLATLPSSTEEFAAAILGESMR